MYSAFVSLANVDVNKNVSWPLTFTFTFNRERRLDLPFKTSGEALVCFTFVVTSSYDILAVFNHGKS